MGTSSFVLTALSSQKAKVDAVSRFPGGTVHVRGVGRIGPTPRAPIVGGTGLYAGEQPGVVEGRHAANGDTLETLRLQVP